MRSSEVMSIGLKEKRSQDRALGNPTLRVGTDKEERQEGSRVLRGHGNDLLCPTFPLDR